MHRWPAAKRASAGICIGLVTCQLYFGYTADQINLSVADWIESEGLALSCRAFLSE
jgi:hypothetical protein